MLTLRSLLNKRRYEGCHNPRQFFFGGQENADTISLQCENTPEGIVQLALYGNGKRMSLQDFPLPDFVQERMAFWERWVNHALEYEWEHPISPYGPEAYGAAIATAISICHPGSRVDWCGLPVHDDYAILHSLEHRDWHTPLPETPPPMEPNRYLAQLRHEEETNGVIPDTGLHFYLKNFCLEGDLLYFDQKHGKLNIYSDMIPFVSSLSECCDCPPALAKECNLCGQISGNEFSYSDLYWLPCNLLLEFRMAAVGIDLLRYAPHHQHVVANDVYTVSTADLPPCP